MDMWCLAKNLGRQTSIRWLVISAFASVPSVSIAEDFCQTVQSALEMKDNGGFPQTVTLAGKSFDCKAISEGAWSCNIAAENQCSPKQDESLVANAGGAKVPPSADEIKVAYERVGSAIAGCFPDKAAQPLEYRSLAPLALTLGRATTPKKAESRLTRWLALFRRRLTTNCVGQRKWRWKLKTRRALSHSRNDQ